MQNEKPIALQIVGKIKQIEDLLFKGLYCHIGDPTKAISLTREAHELFREIKIFYVDCETNKNEHEKKHGISNET